MKIITSFLLAFALLTCAQPTTQGRQPVAGVPEATFLIGYTGGWGGGPAYKLAGGTLFQSVEQRGLGGADAIVNTTFKPFDSATGLRALRDLARQYSAQTFANVPPKFDCQEMAYDGVCPYFIVVQDGQVKAWTKSEVDKDPTFLAFMESVGEALTKM